MDFEKISSEIRDKEIFIGHPSFYTRAFTFAVHRYKQVLARDGDNFKRVCAEEYNALSKRLDRTKVQESCAVRNVLRTRRLANLLIDESGGLNTVFLLRVINYLKSHLYSLGPNRQYDAKRQHHLLKTLTLLHESKPLQQLLLSIDKPISHKYAEQIIRDTLYLPPNTSITHAHTRRAVLAALICLLRQSVGSCFATAPGIIVHTEQPEVFLKDIKELLSTGTLKRTFGGIEYSVPLSASWGAGDLRRPFLLPLKNDFNNSEIWLSPGLEAAFEAIELIDKDDPTVEKVKKIKQLIINALNEKEWSQPLTIITAEEIIRMVLLQQLGLTEQNIIDYENRPKAMIQSGILIQQPIESSKTKSKTELCITFFNQFPLACTALKALSDNALLKAWEFSIASFAETKSQFTRWNLYSSLGLQPEEQGGIGACLYEILKQKLDQANQKVQDFQYEYEQLFAQLKTMESRMRGVSSEKEAQWLRNEYQSKRNEFYLLEDMRNDVHAKAELFANLYNMLMEQYDQLFPRYFQEVYDADMHDIHAGPYDDSPAGFRLLYKYGRTNTSSWTYIKTPNEFIDDLAAFFIATETTIASTEGFETIGQELSEITTAIVSHVRTKEFLETAFHRMAIAHNTRPIRDPLEHLDQIDKKPWAYTSGGTMNTLVSCYYKREAAPTEVSRWMETPIELLVFLVDTVKQMPPKLSEEFLKNPNKSMLIHSPTHAFLFKPGLSPFKEAWQNDAYTYTWVRDNLALPRKRFVESIFLDEEMMEFLIEKLTQSIPESHRHFFRKCFDKSYGMMRTTEFRDYILEGIRSNRMLQQLSTTLLTAEEIDGALYSLLPLFSRASLKERIEKLYAAIPAITEKRREKLLKLFDEALSPSLSSLVDAATLQDTAKGLLCLEMEKTSSEIDYHQAISKAAQQLGYAMPAPILIADTNWVKEEFGFVHNPGSGKFELWRIDTTGREGAPMSSWRHWLDGSRKEPSWGVYTRPYEYHF